MCQTFSHQNRIESAKEKNESGGYGKIITCERKKIKEFFIEVYLPRAKTLTDRILK